MQRPSVTMLESIFGCASNGSNEWFEHFVYYFYVITVCRYFKLWQCLITSLFNYCYVIEWCIYQHNYKNLLFANWSEWKSTLLTCPSPCTSSQKRRHGTWMYRQESFFITFFILRLQSKSILAECGLHCSNIQGSITTLTTHIKKYILKKTIHLQVGCFVARGDLKKSCCRCWLGGCVLTIFLPSIVNTSHCAF